MSRIQTDVLIVGAGPAGLATAAHLRKKNIPFEIIEKSAYVGSAWRAHYDRLCLHTIKELSALPFVPFPEEYPRYVTRAQLVDYFDNYKEQFDIKPIFNTAATAIKKSGEGWEINTNTDKSFLAQHLIVAMGVNHSPNHPKFKDDDLFKGQIIHSKVYKRPDPFKGKHVLVVGFGNTGAEVALDLAEKGAASTTVSIRGEVNIVPRDFKGRPTQLTALQLNKLPNWLGDWIGVQLRKITMGDMPKYGIKFPKMPPAKQLRTIGKTPVVDLGTADFIRAGKIKIVNSGIQAFEENGVIFEDGQKQNFDVVILATGYKANVIDLIENGTQMVDQYGWPKFVIGEGDTKGLYFIGYDNYTAGGILGVINRDSALIAEHIAN